LSAFQVVYDGFDPTNEGLREALTSTGNGYFCTRGCAEWQEADDTHYPGTYAHGIYNRRTTVVGVSPRLNEDLVNLPNWLLLKLRIGEGEPFRLADVDVLSYRHAYDFRNALLVRELSFRDGEGRETSLRSRRFVSMHRMHLAALAWDLTALNWSGKVEIVSALDGRVVNQGVARYRRLEGRHLDPQGPRTGGSDVIALKTRTRQSRIEVAEAARTRVYRGGVELDVARTTYQTEDYIHQVLTHEMEAGATIRVEKNVAFYSSRDRGISEPLEAAIRSVGLYPTFDEELEDQTSAWDELWEVCDHQLPREEQVQFLLRFHTAHLLQVCSRQTAHHDAGVPARGLNGEAYRGHVFWDELFLYPFLNFRQPAVSRGLLLYRYRRISEAREAARRAGYQGAMFPWQSGSDGKEQTQSVHLNPLSGRWDPDLSRNQRHVGAAIFYAVWQYHLTTNEFDFLRDCGAEMMLEIARFWASIAHHNPETDRWEIHGVMGPDEFHERYPGAAEGGLRNNAYTNVMAAWIAETAQRVLELLPTTRREALRKRIGLTDEEIEVWGQMSRRMFVPFHADGVISQFEGYEDLEELDWDGLRARHGNIQRLDRILRAEGDDPNRYKASKQADTLMLFYLFRDAELRRLFAQLGYDLQPERVFRTIEYYDKRTSHGSTLSLIVHAGVLANTDPESSWERFLEALHSDIHDIQGGTTAEGIHTGVMAGTLDLVQRIYLGAEVREGVVFFAPRLRERLDGLRVLMQFRSTPIRVGIDGSELTVEVLTGGFGQPVRIGVGEDVRELNVGERGSFSLGSRTVLT
jgi:trehalose/maltose hydrolase-like predicted phosphorylase